MSLTLLPAVDVRDGKAVRLRQGESGSETDYGSPLEAARTWVEAGAEWIHLVDLDAAFGTGNNRAQLREIVHELGDKVNIETICRTAFFRLHVVKYHAYSQAKELMDFTHPLGISFSQVVVDGYDVDTFSLKGIQVCRKCGNKSFTFTCFHLGDTALVKDDTTDDLYTVMLHSKHTLGSLTYGGKCLRKKIIQCFAFCKTFLIFSGLVP